MFYINYNYAITLCKNKETVQQWTEYVSYTKATSHN